MKIRQIKIFEQRLRYSFGCLKYSNTHDDYWEGSNWQHFHDNRMIGFCELESVGNYALDFYLELNI